MISNTLSKHTITALVQDKPGVLNRISSMFRRRGFNISSLAVGQSESETLSRMTFVVDGDDKVVEQVTKHLHKLIDVIKVTDISEENVISRELALIKVKAGAEHRDQVMQISSMFRANIIDVSKDFLLVEATGDENKINSLINLLRDIGISEVMRTGSVAMNRASNKGGKKIKQSIVSTRKCDEAASV